jgi:hypothetical protein
MEIHYTHRVAVYRMCRLLALLSDARHGVILFSGQRICPS